MWLSIMGKFQDMPRRTERKERGRNERKIKQHLSCIEKVKTIHLLAKNTFEHSEATIGSQCCARDQAGLSHSSFWFGGSKTSQSTRFLSSGNICRASIQSRTRISCGKSDRSTPVDLHVLPMNYNLYFLDMSSDNIPKHIQRFYFQL